MLTNIRVCADFSTGLNQCLNLHHYPLSTSEVIFAALRGGQKFSVIDFSDAYFQIEVDKESKKLLVINTHKGLLRYKRLAFGVSAAPMIYQKVMDQMLSNLPGVAWCLDDIMVTGKSDDEHIKNLISVFERIKDYNFKIKASKSKFFHDSIEFFGLTVDKHGIHKSPKKIAAIIDMKPPSNLKELESFVGMVVYYSRFFSHLSDLCHHLNLLRKKDAVWNWSTDCKN